LFIAGSTQRLIKSISDGIREKKMMDIFVRQLLPIFGTIIIIQIINGKE
jgi:hypothetical protein